MKFTLTEIAQITNGQLFGDNLIVDGVSTDTRSLQAGNLFIALVGEKFNPHELIETGQADHAGAVLVERQLNANCAQIVVPNTYTALQELAVVWRNKFNLPVVGVTGSNGKTSVKELIKQILSAQGEVLATLGNLNNHIGVPLTLMGLADKHCYAVVEMGANHTGEIAVLTQLANPDVGVVTNIGPAHLEGFGSLEGVARAKAELYRHMNLQGIAVVNADEPYCQLWQEYIGERMQITFGVEQNADVVGKTIDLDLINIVTPIGEMRVQLQAFGQHVVYNALAATAVCLGLGIDLDDIKTGLEATKPVSGRLTRLKGIGGACILDDTYNANPASLFVALDVQAQEASERWLVLGDMCELGSESIAWHKKAGEMAKEFGVTRLFGIGELARHTVDAFGTGAEHFSNHVAVAEILQNELYEQVCVLVKGSRAMHLEKIVTAIHKNINSQSTYNEYAA